MRLLERHSGRNESAAAPRLLDVGCWDGEATTRYARILGAQACGIEIFEQPAAEAHRRGVEVVRLDLETEKFPWPDCSVDVAVANQVFEHLKNIWMPMSETYRVLKPGGVLVASVPNLASLHNRILLGLGMQPTSIRTFGPHVRAFARRDFEAFVAYAGVLKIERSIGVGFYPLPASWARPLALVWPGASHTAVVVARKLSDRPAPWTPRPGSWEQTYYR